jgi:thiol-disulfide isomerase/thioredoxin
MRVMKSVKYAGVVVFALAAALFLGAWHPAESAGGFPNFSSKTLEGKDVTNALFAGKKLTMVNLWATWCPPCVAEMPDLGKLGRSMPEGSQLMGILLDADYAGAIDKGKAILAKSKADFLQVQPSKEMTSFLDTVAAIPTTVFVDAEGRILGEPIVGARSEAEYRAEIEKALAKVAQESQKTQGK